MVDFPASHVSFRGCTSFPDQSDTMHQTYKALHETTLLGLPFVAGQQIRDVDSGCFRGRCGFLFEGKRCLVGGFKDFLFSPLLGEMILFD